MNKKERNENITRYWMVLNNYILVVLWHVGTTKYLTLTLYAAAFTVLSCIEIKLTPYFIRIIRCSVHIFCASGALVYSHQRYLQLIWKYDVFQIFGCPNLMFFAPFQLVRSFSPSRAVFFFEGRYDFGPVLLGLNNLFLSPLQALLSICDYWRKTTSIEINSGYSKQKVFKSISAPSCFRSHDMRSKTDVKMTHCIHMPCNLPIWHIAIRICANWNFLLLAQSIIFCIFWYIFLVLSI